nr:AMIN domain-containing protein [Dulcicalothrix desertica]
MYLLAIGKGYYRKIEGESFTFRSEKPIPGITEINVTNVDDNTVRVTVVGEKAPTVCLDRGLISRRLYRVTKRR